MTIQKDAPVGTVISSVSTTFNLAPSAQFGAVSCSGGTSNFYYNMINGVSSGFENVYKTNVAGVGIMTCRQD